MPTDSAFAWLESHPGVGRQLLALLTSANTPADFWPDALALCIAQVPARSASVLRSDGARWHPLASVGAAGQPSTELLADTLDQERTLHAGGWIASPLAVRERDPQVLAVHIADGSERPDPIAVQTVAALAEVLRAALGPLREREQCHARAKRLEAILAIVGQWNQTLELEQLLARMAEASTQLFDAERASIFLWDRRAKTLVGRPALGVPGGELRIPDTQGVVGQVVQTGSPRRVGAADDQGEIDHSVDQKLQFRTRSLLCVPLFAHEGAVLGAFELINKRHGDFTPEDEAGLIELAEQASIALVNSREHEQLLRSRNQVAAQAAARVQLIGECAAIHKLRHSIERVAATDLAVLVLGENGTGKEVVAQLVHYLSKRRQEPFVAVNCAALPDSLLESELFGHEKGAFTDAREMRQGKFELASGGTLLLDEIGDLSLAGQAKLLRVIEEKVVVRVGGSMPIPTDARIIAATNHDLAELVQQKRFRQDLYFRLTVVTLTLPPLRERDEDPLLLAEHFLREFSLKARRPPPMLTAAAKKRLLAHTWPGNVRELRNLMERLAYLSAADKIDAEDLSFNRLTSPAARHSLLDGDEPLSEATRQFQTQYIQAQIDRAHGNMTLAAERLGLHRSNLYRKMGQLGMKVTPE